MLVHHNKQAKKKKKQTRRGLGDAPMQQYCASTGGTISESLSFGTDPLEGDPIKSMIRYDTFCARFCGNREHANSSK